MSTRSGKRIHASSESPIVDKDVTLQSERKTRSKKPKENIEHTIKKRHNYVSYPAEVDTPSVSSEAAEPHEKVRKTRRNTLKELNVQPLPDSGEANNDGNTVRKSRRGKKFIVESENVENIVNVVNHADFEPVSHNKKKNKKRKTHKKESIEATVVQDEKNHVKDKKGIKKKLKRKNLINNDLETENMDAGINDSLDSFHSAAGSPLEINHVGNDGQTGVLVTPVGYIIEEKMSITNSKLADVTPSKTTDSPVGKEKKSERNVIEDIDIINLNSTFDKLPRISIATVELPTKKNKKSSIKNSTFDRIDHEVNEDKINTTFDKMIDTPTSDNTTKDVSLRKRKRSTIDIIQSNDLDDVKLNATFDKNNLSVLNTTEVGSNRKRRKSSTKNSTYDKIEPNETESANEKFLNSTFDHGKPAGNLVNGNLTDNTDRCDVTVTLTPTQNTDESNDTLNTSKSRRKSGVINTTYDKIEKNGNENIETNITFDKDDTALQTSSDDKSLNGRKSSQNSNTLNDSEDVTSNGEIAPEKCNNLDSTLNDNNAKLNTTFDTEKSSAGHVDSTKSSLISSDGTNNETFDKSGEISRISITSDESKTENILNHTPVLIESSIDESLMSEDKSPAQTEVPVTPLKREGTFTKEVSDVVSSPPNPTGSAEKTPVKRKSSPGCTPFPFSKVYQKENAKLNVTRSIEKTLRKSSVVEAAPRQTRVMFCSPANNPAVVSQVKGRVIKSNLKGSNKSFVFDDSVSEARAVRRKRSLTLGSLSGAGGAGGAGGEAKRKRLGDDLQSSVDRLSRPRTQSAAAKLSEPSTPSKKATPSKAKIEKSEKAVPRTKLPNFAALHQRQFARMESLDECQRRRARRARQLLTPTGSVGIIERISPKGTGTPPQPAPAPAAKEPAKLTPAKPNLPTLDSLVPRYTRFGFKLNVDENPFSVKTDAKKERPNDRAKSRAHHRTMSERAHDRTLNERAHDRTLSERPHDRTLSERPHDRTLNERAHDRTLSERPSRQTCLPSLAGAVVAGARREAARQAVMRDKSFTERRHASRDQTRTVIKGVRTNRRFELQMKMRNIQA